MKGFNRDSMSYSKFKVESAKQDTFHQLYLAEAEVPDSIAEDLVLPSLIDNHLDLDKVFYWEGYNTSSLPHTDDVENIMCVFTGQKTWKVVSPFN